MTSVWDDRACDLFGIPRGERVPIGAFLLLVWPDDRAIVEAANRSIYDPSSPGRYVIDFREAAGGGRRWFRGFARGIYAQGRLRRVIGTVIDITAAKDSERELERLVAEAREAVRARDEFLSIASHELRTPLTPLQLQQASGFPRSTSRTSSSGSSVRPSRATTGASASGSTSRGRWSSCADPPRPPGFPS